MAIDPRSRLAATLKEVPNRADRASTGFLSFARRQDPEPPPPMPTEIPEEQREIPTVDIVSMQRSEHPVNQAPLPVLQSTEKGKGTSTLAKLASGRDLAKETGGTKRSIIFDTEVWSFLRTLMIKQSAAQKRRVTLTSIIHEGLKNPLDPETARAGKELLTQRHRLYGTVSTNVIIPDSLLEAMQREVEAYTTTRTMLSIGAVAELRVASWAVQHPLWPT